MARLLRMLGLAILAAATILLVAGEAGAVPERIVDLAFLPAIQAGGIAFVAGLVLSVLAPFGRMLRRGRCVRCNAPIEKSQTYCRDHLRTAVQEFQDQARGGS